MKRIEALRALLLHTAAAEHALEQEEYDRFAELVTARGQAMAALDAGSDELTSSEAQEAGEILRSLKAADERLVTQVAARLGETRTEISQQQLATSTVSAYRHANRRVAPQFAARFVDQQK
ncbi:MAG TPA: flagellar protein FliT [Symbiobacteriaceae bacterium]|nr:flagellar protein FliT [Symbiobacteriaceae bacterium]